MALRSTGAGVALTAGIILLTGLIIAGFYWAGGAAEQARRDEATQIAQEQLEQNSSEGVALNEGDGSGESSNDENASESSSQSEGVSQSEGSSANESTSGPAAEMGASELPQTGPSETFGALLGAGSLTFAVAAYATSRHKLRDTL